MIWLLLLGFIFVLLVDAFRCGLLDKVKEELNKIIKKIKKRFFKPLFNRSKKQDK